MKNDQVIGDLIKLEEKRQAEYVELIASENFCSDDVREAVGSVLTNKYAEGYPFARYYGGCNIIDQVEELAIERLKAIFHANFANVQPHSGSQANMAAYLAIIKPGDKILGMSLTSGGHLTHGFKVSATGQIFKSQAYEVSPITNRLDYEMIRKQALEFRPKLIICGASAYSRIIDWKAFKTIADEIDAYVVADVAHIAGLIVAGLHPNPLDFGIDIVTSTTHKTLRGPRGGIILTNDPEIAKKINKAVFPGTQGGPLEHVIAGKAIAFKEAASPEYKSYIQDVVANAKIMAKTFKDNGATIITGGTDNHLFMINVVKTYNITGKQAEDLLFEAHIVVNKNTIPYETLSPTITSGIRIGTPAMTTHGFKAKDFIKLANIIDEILKKNDLEFAKAKSAEVKGMM